MHWECIVSHALQNVLRIRNAIPSILRENVLVYLSLDIICSAKLTSSLSSIYFVLWIFSLNVFEREYGYRWKYLILIINSKSKKLKWKNSVISLFQLSFQFHSPFLILYFPSPIPHSKSSILQSPFLFPFSIHHSSLSIPHSSLSIPHSSLSIPHSPFLLLVTSFLHVRNKFII